MLAIIDCKAFLNSAPLKAKFIFQVVSPEGMLELLLLAEELLEDGLLLEKLLEELLDELDCWLEELLDELDCWLEELLLPSTDEAEELESSEEAELFELSSTLVVLVVLLVLDSPELLLEVCVVLKQPLNTKAKVARIMGIIFFLFIGLYYITLTK